VLTSFKVNVPSPETSPSVDQWPYNRSDEDATPHRPAAKDPDSTRTIAHLHLFTMPVVGKGSPSRPSTAGTLGSSTKRRPGTSSGMGFLNDKIEVDRRAITASTSAGIWDGTAEEGSGREKEKDWAGKNWVVRIGFGGEGEWFCDMPNA
jgi:hypothetical protein